MPRLPGPTQSGKRETTAKSILTSGIPLEMAVYDLLASGFDADWIEPEYGFTSLDETGKPIQPSIDFVSSLPTSRDPLEERSIQLYLLTECKYCNPNEVIWILMPDVSLPTKNVFDEWRPALWQEREPLEPISQAEIEKIVRRKPAPRPRGKESVPRCVRGATPGLVGSQEGKGAQSTEKRNVPALATALHQLRDGLHYLATERFRLFTKQWSQPAAIVFVPVLVTNAELRVLKPGIHQRLLAAQGHERLSLDEVSSAVLRALVRCPRSLKQVDWKWQEFQLAHGKYNLGRVEKGLPAYKRERTIEAHLRNFFSTTPKYVMAVRLEQAKNLLTEVVDWAKSLEFR